MEIQQLKYFVEICIHKSFSKAAEVCYVSPQGISMSIQRLEVELQCKLFIRQRTSLQLTKHALFLLPKAVEILHLMDSCDSYFSVGKDKEQRVKLAMSVSSFNTVALNAVEKFRAKYPQIFLDVSKTTDRGAESAVRSHEAELAICTSLSDSECFDRSLVCSEQYAAIISAEHPLAQKKTVSVLELASTPLAIARDCADSFLIQSKKIAPPDSSLHIGNRVDSIILVFDSVERYGCIGITTTAPITLVDTKKYNFRIIPFEEPEMKWRLYAIRRKSTPMTCGCQLFFSILHQQVSGEPTASNV